MRPLSYLKTKIAPRESVRLLSSMVLFDHVGALSSNRNADVSGFVREGDSPLDRSTDVQYCYRDRRRSCLRQVSAFFLMKTNADAVYAFEPATDLQVTQ
jgi:hypothetical protein